ncbi:hypothetical protein GDO86_015969 [Hymenochirus boettgeri]|uniref:Uncharacterized protein n=1 Tax=Hymenochirus boettgeri TaxID=247094 RepID=A0A8T2JZD8_9PIPI|nr:hypothetical protein GDO86_015969 [Hymenochirus boettgeri]
MSYNAVKNLYQWCYKRNEMYRPEKMWNPKHHSFCFAQQYTGTLKLHILRSDMNIWILHFQKPTDAIYTLVSYFCSSISHISLLLLLLPVTLLCQHSSMF